MSLEDVFKIALFCFLALVLLFLVGITAFDAFQYEEIEGTVVDKYIKTEDDAGVFYFVIETENGKEVLEDTDSIAYRKYNSADVYQDIELGATYKFGLQGVRRPYFSKYRNIVRYEVIDE